MDLIQAVMIGDSEAVQKLVHTSNVNTPDHSGRTPLMAAVFKNLTRIAEMLLDAGADMYAKDNEDYSVIYYAAVHGNFESVMVLYERGFQYNNDSKAFDEAILESGQNGHSHIVELLEAIKKKQSYKSVN